MKSNELIKFIYENAKMGNDSTLMLLKSIIDLYN